MKEMCSLQKLVLASPSSITHHHTIVMPIAIFGEVYYNGLQAVPWLYTALKFAPWLVALYILKLYFNGTYNENVRVMHSKVAIVTVRLPFPTSGRCCGWNAC